MLISMKLFGCDLVDDSDFMRILHQPGFLYLSEIWRTPGLRCLRQVAAPISAKVCELWSLLCYQAYSHSYRGVDRLYDRWRWWSWGFCLPPARVRYWLYFVYVSEQWPESSSPFIFVALCQQLLLADVWPQWRFRSAVYWLATLKAISDPYCQTACLYLTRTACDGVRLSADRLLYSLQQLRVTSPTGLSL